MYLIFYKTNNVFLAEGRIKSKGYECDVVPTPVQDIAYCGICLETSEAYENAVVSILVDLEHKVFFRSIESGL